MKFNWGTGILLFIILFFVVIFSFVYFTTTQKINLVEEDYYEKELMFQQQIDRKKNTKPFIDHFIVRQHEDALAISFPGFFKDKKMDGSIHFYRPSDEKLDLLYKLELDSTGAQYFSMEKLQGGKYIVKISWTADSIPYYFEETLLIN